MIDATILQVLEEYSIKHSDIKKVKPIFSGINRVHLVETNESKFILKEYIKLSEADLPDIHDNLITLMEKGMGVPKIIKNVHGEYLTKLNKRNFDLSEFIEHIDLSDQLTISNENLKLAAKELAKIHKTTNTSEISKNLKRVDFKSMIKETLKVLKAFENEYENLLKIAEQKDREKLKILKQIIEQTSEHRSRGIESFSKFLSQEFVPTHGDYSMLNVLIRDKEVFVIDWDNFKLRPLVWDIQAALSLFSLSVLGNAYFVEPDLEKAKIFLEAYLEENHLDKEILILLPEAAKFNFSIYWLSYTIPAVLKKDFRLLYLIPDDVKKSLYWTKNFGKYVDFIEKID